MVDRFTIQSSALPGAAQLAGFHGSEGISRLYHFDVFLLMVDDVGHDFDLRSAVGAKATLKLERSDGRPAFVVNGIFASMELVSDFHGRSVFHAVLVPRFWHLTQSLHSRMFTQESITTILAAVLDQGGLAGAYALQLLGSYAVQEHVCQYHESDFDFVSRWMEREGLYYYFEQDEDEERLIITDSLSTHRVLGDRPVRYFPQEEGIWTSDRFRAFTCRHSSLPASVRMKDYDYTRPTFAIGGQAPVSPSGVGEISVHGSRFFTPGEGAHLAQVKAQSLLAGEVVYQGSGAAAYLRPGYFFELEDHPRAAFNTSYLTTELEHWVNVMPRLPEVARIMPWDDVYRVEASAIPKAVQYRAPQRTAWPRIYGGEHAVVDGPAVSEYAQIDSHGRYAVKFHFDESALTGGKASTWVRMLQPHGGGIEGFHFPLRVGTEVVCTFSGGDPDRPFIVGVAPNALTPSPVTSANNTRNVIQTGGRNRWELEDKAGQERITMSTPHANTYIRMGAPNDAHTIIVQSDGDGLIQVNNLDVEVGANLTENVTGDVTRTVTGGATETVTKAVGETYKDSFAQSVGTTRTTQVTGNSSDEIGGNETRHVHGTSSPTFDGDVDEVYNSNRTYSVSGAYNQHIKKNSVSTVEGNFTNIIKGSQSTVVLGALNSNCEGLRTTSTVGGALTATFLISASNVLGGSFSGVEGWALNYVLGWRQNITNGAAWTTVTGDQTSFVGGLVTGTILGGKVETIAGFKCEQVAGVTYKNAIGGEVKDVAGLRMSISNGLAIDSEEAKIAMRTFNLTMADFSVTTG